MLQVFLKLQLLNTRGWSVPRQWVQFETEAGLSHYLLYQEKDECKVYDIEDRSSLDSWILQGSVTTWNVCGLRTEVLGLLGYCV